ncbi:MAG: site-2 protease family protein [Oscillospiraceae bacterium]|nr:site-2 protease family protein [Oscillospiraceae bacterium]
MWRIKGTAVTVSPALPVVLALFVLLSSPLLLAALVLAALCHEWGHYAVLRRFGVGVKHLRLSAFGAEMDVGNTSRMSYGAEMLTVLAGPAVNLALAVLLGGLGYWWETAYVFAGANLVLGVFNLLPAPPLDGGRLLWLATAWLTEPFTADRITSAVGLMISGALAAAGILLTCRTGGSPFLLLGAVGLLITNLRQKGLVKSPVTR